MERPFADSGVMNKSRCMICGRMHNTNIREESSTPSKVHIKGDDCYTIYKKLLGIYGASFIVVLNSY
ncbi:MAG TPA: hypothetical protein VFV86_06765 [Nitrososphaeraceae archaeon]|jgi:hypothetical protein|nr:hypothetical protein [Nitrososphaeraceae archaeon]